MIWEQIVEAVEKVEVFNEERATADRLGKPLLNAGCGILFSRAIIESDVNLDVTPRDVPRFVLGNIEDLSMFRDKEFGAVFVSHVLEHVKDLERARAELHRVADYQFVITPSPFFLSGWLSPWHRRIFKDTQGKDVLLELPLKPWQAW